MNEYRSWAVLLALDEFAKEAHKGQRYGEYDYFEEHILSVYGKINKLHLEYCDEETLYMLKCTALLHDVLEDTSKTEHDIVDVCKNAAASDEWIGKLISAVKALTKDGKCEYDEYIKGVLENDIARMVKYADALCNFEACVADGNEKWASKYVKVMCKIKAYEKEMFN